MIYCFFCSVFIRIWYYGRWFSICFKIEFRWFVIELEFTPFKFVYNFGGYKFMNLFFNNFFNNFSIVTCGRCNSFFLFCSGTFDSFLSLFIVFYFFLLCLVIWTSISEVESESDKSFSDPESLFESLSEFEECSSDSEL